jgi:hypothetical protein
LRPAPALELTARNAPAPAALEHGGGFLNIQPQETM